jgi:hypothetical protein
MKHVGLVFLIVILLIGSVGYMLTPTKAHAFANTNATKWEYCEIGVVIPDLSNKKDENVFYAAGEKRVQEVDWESVGKALGFECKTRHEIFNCLGTQGWEMTTAFTYPNLRFDGGIHSIEHRWIFKRVAK